jgi:hypothetical protein
MDQAAPGNVAANPLITGMGAPEDSNLAFAAFRNCAASEISEVQSASTRLLLGRKAVIVLIESSGASTPSSIEFEPIPAKKRAIEMNEKRHETWPYSLTIC